MRLLRWSPSLRRLRGATVTRSFAYEAATTGPIANHSLSFTVSYDDVVFGSTVTLLAIDYSIGATMFSPANAQIIDQSMLGLPPGDFFFLFGSVSGTGFSFVNGFGNDDFALQFELADLGNTSFSYSTASLSPNFGSAPPDVPLIPITNPVPEPATWAMMVLGLGAIGGALRRARRVAPPR